MWTLASRGRRAATRPAQSVAHFAAFGHQDLGEAMRGVSKGSEALHASLAEADKAGFLGKRSEVVKQWRRRWFALRGDTLYWAQSNRDAPRGCMWQAPFSERRSSRSQP